jgi:ABC-type tungstate transport system substrate-binding protein
VVVRLVATQLVLVLPTLLLPALQTARARERRVLLEQLLALLVLPTVLVLT